MKRRGFPVVELGDRADSAIAIDIASACEAVGFLVITGHGAPASVFDALVVAAKRFFACPAAIKEKYAPPPEVNRGYTRLASRSLARSMGVSTPPDLREGFTINRLDHRNAAYFNNPAAGSLFALNIWPSEEDAPGLRGAFETYYSEMERLAARLMRLFALALELPPRFFDHKIDKHFSNCVAYHYPPIPGEPEPGQLRGGAHTDFGSLTLLYAHPSYAGLQIFIDGEWIDAPTIPGSIVVNIGDLMAQWTNDRWRSTLHRVTAPDPATRDQSRLSVAFFHQPNYDVVIESLDRSSPPKYAPG